MIQHNTFYETPLQHHIFLHRKETPNQLSSQRHIDDVLRDIHHRYIKEKQISSDNLLCESFSQESHSIVAEKIQEISLQHQSRHSRHYTVHNLNRITTIEQEDAGSAVKDPSAEEEKLNANLAEDSRNNMTNMVSCAINYKSPEELLQKLQAHSYITSGENISTVDRKPTFSSSFEESLEDEQLKQLADIRRWRAQLMGRVESIVN